MAVTKTHPIKSTLKAAIEYICNPVFGSGVTNPKVSGVHDQIQPEKKSHYHHSL